ncbi:TIGR00341 family protein [Altererythrobacter aerius]|uniref:TIGR00341 family protein n=1 Tax=Tsuneonella aeria TaxID=1837929 RepID=A0A6I4TDC1_9SPHN|nr:TIGR00341 family protein [Tsuneonella aeria]MXO75301.1 TIGR00341 family protein [Tsuneonella aeria]
MTGAPASPDTSADDAPGADTGMGRGDAFKKPARNRDGNRKGYSRAATLAAIARDARLSRGYVLQVVLATALAQLGLLMNSPPVVIGAMLISPLLGPIMGFGFSIAVFDGRLLRRSLQTLAAGTVIAIAVGALLTAFSPMTDATPALLARVRPSLLDLLVAIFGGLAGAYAILKRSSATIVGVAIATALIPPLATVGWALVTGRYGSAGGALLLYITNTAAIAAMAALVARFNGFGADLSPRQTGIQTVGVIAALSVVAVPLVVSLSNIIREARANSVLRQDLADHAGDSAIIDSFAIDFGGQRPEVSTVVISPSFIPALEEKLARSARARLGPGVRTRVVQLRSGTAEAEDARRTATREAELHADSVHEGQQLRAALAAAYRLDSAAILIDVDRRQALVRLAATRPEDASADGTSVDLAPLRAAFSDWEITPALVRPEPEPQPSPSPAPVEGD